VFSVFWFLYSCGIVATSKASAFEFNSFENSFIGPKFPYSVGWKVFDNSSWYSDKGTHLIIL